MKKFDTIGTEFEVAETKTHAIRRTPCYRCGGSGIYSSWHGECWTCGGTGTFSKKVKLYTAEELAAYNQRKLDAANRKQAKLDAEIAARKAERNALLTAEQKLIIGKATFVANTLPTGKAWIDSRIAACADIMRSGEAKGFTAPMVDALEKIVQFIGEKTEILRQEKAAAEDPCNWVKAGRYQIEGVVVTVKEVEGIYGTAWKMLIQVGHQKFWGTIPNGMATPYKGDTVRVTGTVERSKDDPLFGFFKRPSKGEIVAEAVATAA
jgi:hypothetical protein